MNINADKAAVAVASYLEARAALAGAADAAHPVLPWMLARYVAGSQVPDQVGLVDALRRDLGLYRLYRDLLAARAVGLSPRQAAAQGREASPAREGEGFRLEFRRSRASGEQVYVTLVLASEPERVDGTAVQLHVLAADALLRLEFPPLAEHRSQRIFLADSPELALLRRGDTELLLVLP